VLDRPITLSVSALARTVEANNLGELHRTLTPRSGWMPLEERQRADGAARAEIASVGGVDRRGRLDVDLQATLSLLCTPRVEFYGWMSFHGQPAVGVLVAASGRDAVLAIRDGDVVRLAQVQSERLADVLVAQTPDVPAARGQAVSVVLADLKSPPAASMVAVSARPHQTPELKVVQQIMDTPTTGSGQLFTALRDQMGRRHVVEYPLRYGDTVYGRWLNLTVPGAEPRVLLAPADRGALASRVHDMHMNLARR
jgi:hypothetical protein